MFDHINNKNFWTKKDNIDITKWKATDWEKIFSPYKGDRVIYTVYKDVLLTKKNAQYKNGQRIRTNNSEKRREQMLNLTGNHEIAN